MSATAPLLTTPLNALHIELGARMVPFAGYSMPVQYPAGLMAEHQHTRSAAGLFDVSHMGQLKLVGPDAAAAFETLMPVDVIDLPVGKQRYGLLLTDEGTIIDDLMFFNQGVVDGEPTLFVIVNGACKVGDIAHIQARIGQRCQVVPMPDHALLALQGPQAVTALARLPVVRVRAADCPKHNSATFAFSAARSKANVFPMPFDAPVIRATLFSRYIIGFCDFVSHLFRFKGKNFFFQTAFLRISKIGGFTLCTYLAGD